MIAIISDIHGNYEALKEVLNIVDKKNIKEIYCLGDVVGYYPQVNECCDELRERNAKCVMGNHDWYLISRTKCERSNSVNDCLRFQDTIISETNRQWISQFPVIRNIGEVSFVHGGWKNPIDEYLNPTYEYFDTMRKGIYLSGHTHIQSLLDINGTIYCNPGSVGQPRDNDNRAAFAILHEDIIELHRVSYDYTKIGELMEQIGFSGYYYECLKNGAKHLGYQND